MSELENKNSILEKKEDLENGEDLAIDQSNLENISTDIDSNSNSQEDEAEKKATSSITKLAQFEMPNRLIKEEETFSETYGKFVAEPFESGYGHTVGNSLRRVLLSSIEGAAITSVHIAGVQHEFATLPGVMEDVTEILLNLKQVKFRHHGKDTKVLKISVEKEGEVTAGDIQEDAMYEVVNKDQLICTIDTKTKFEAELEINVGRGFNTQDENKKEDLALGHIPMDSIFSPILRVKYALENTRVGQKTDYDKLILEIWTDGRIEPADALVHSSAILTHHLDVFVKHNDKEIEFENASNKQNEENAELKKLLNMSVNEIEFSVRASNCLSNANIGTVGQLATKTEAEMLKFRNFGKKSLNEIKDKLVELGLSLGMQIDPSLLEQPFYSAMPEIEDNTDYDDSDSAGLVELIQQNYNEED